MKKSSLFLLPFLVLFMIGCQSGPKLTPEEARAKWQAPIVASAFNVAICEGATETAQKVQSGEIEGFTVLGELMGTGIMIQVVEESLAAVQPEADQVDLVSQMQSDIEALRGVLGPWLNQETTSADVLATIGDVCTDTNKTFEQVVEAASDDGMSQEAMGAMLDEVATAMDAAQKGSE